MDTIEDKNLDQFLSSGDGKPVTPEHRAWMNEQIRQTLAKKEGGNMGYTPLDEVRREFQLDAS